MWNCIVTSLQNVLITSAGSWKLAGFGFAISAAHAGNLDNMQSFHYSVSVNFEMFTFTRLLYILLYSAVQVR